MTVCIRKSCVLTIWHHGNGQTCEVVSGDMDISTQNFADIISLPEADVNEQAVEPQEIFKIWEESESGVIQLHHQGL